MEGPTISSNKLRFTESRRKFRVTQNAGTLPSHKLIAAANNHKLVILGFEDETIKAIELAQVLDFTQSKERAEIMDLNQFAFETKLTFRPTLLTVACYGFSSVLLVCGQKNFPQCPVIEAFDLDTRNSIGKVELPELAGSNLIDYAWSPNYFDSIVAICSSRGHLIVLAIDRPKAISIVYQNQHYGALTCCWSPKGKNLAVGQSNGRIIRLEPQISGNTFTFKEVDKSTLIFSHQKMTPNHQVIKLRWINKNFLIAIHACPSNLSGPDTIYSIITVKPSKPYKYWTNLCYENSTSQNYTTHIVNLSNAVICSSNATGEAAVLGVEDASAAARNDLDDWKSIMIDEEGARVELPLDRNNRETSALSVTLAQTEHPILLFYSSDGVVIAYAALHVDPIFKLPEFQPKLGCPIEIPKISAFQSSMFSNQPPSIFGQAQASVAPQPSIFGSSLADNPLSGLKAPTFQPNQPIDTPKPFNFQSTFAQTQPKNMFSSNMKPVFHNPLQPIKTAPAPQTLPTSFNFQSTSLLGNQLSMLKSPLSQTEPQTEPGQPTKTTPVKSSPFGSETQPPTNAFAAVAQKAQTGFFSGGLFDSQLSFTKPTEPVLVGASMTAQTATLDQTPAQKPTTIQKQATDLSLTSKPTAQKLVPDQIRTERPQLQNLFSDQAPSLGSTTQDASAFKNEIKEFDDEIKGVKSVIESNKTSLEMFDEINSLKAKFDDILDIHRSLREALDVSKETIDSLTVQMLDNLYLIEHIKLHNKDGSKKRTVDRLTLDKVDAVKKKTKNLDSRLKELDSIVEMAWEDFNRRKSNPASKTKQPRSLDLIYRSLATNQKIINVLKNRAAEDVAKSPGAKKPVDYKSEPIVTIRKELDPARLRNFKEFLSSRDVAPVRRPD